MSNANLLNSPELIVTKGPKIRIFVSVKLHHPSWCCQSCGDDIGWIGRFIFPFFHKCKEASK